MTAMPKRIQRKRTKGWQMPEGAVYVGRPSKWGNPFDWRDSTDDGIYGAHEMACSRFADNINERDRPYPTQDEIVNELRGKDLACWCPLDMPCHADVLIELANRSERHVESQPTAGERR